MAEDVEKAVKRANKRLHKIMRRYGIADAVKEIGEAMQELDDLEGVKLANTAVTADLPSGAAALAVFSLVENDELHDLLNQDRPDSDSDADDDEGHRARELRPLGGCLLGEARRGDRPLPRQGKRLLRLQPRADHAWLHLRHLGSAAGIDLHRARRRVQGVGRGPDMRGRGAVMRRGIAAWIVSMVALCFASATVFDILLFRNYAAVPFHASSASQMRPWGTAGATFLLT